MILLINDPYKRKNKMNYVPFLLAIGQTFTSTMVYTFLIIIMDRGQPIMLSLWVSLFGPIDGFSDGFWGFLVFRNLLIVNLMRFQSRTRLCDHQIKLPAHFKREKCIVFSYIGFLVIQALDCA